MPSAMPVVDAAVAMPVVDAAMPAPMDAGKAMADAGKKPAAAKDAGAKK